MDQQPELPDRCPRCWCDDCGGTLAEHTPAGCQCENCTEYSSTPCLTFEPSERIAILHQQLAPLLSAHLDARSARRCTAIAHAAHHALIDYDHPAPAARPAD
ncbi:hypothetical protein [Kitasatospora sp. NPDC004289]